MLLVPTYVAPSPIAGVGLFSAADLPAGTRIWEFTEGVDWRIPEADFHRFPEPYLSRLRHHAYLDEEGGYVLCMDNAKFMNHHRDPNCTDADARYTVTVRPVKAGEELTCNYAEFDLETRANGLPWSGEGSAP